VTTGLRTKSVYGLNDLGSLTGINCAMIHLDMIEVGGVTCHM
jgi:hypothetical protein